MSGWIGPNQMAWIIEALSDGIAELPATGPGQGKLRAVRDALLRIALRDVEVEAPERVP
jgi:hypothetical protein